MIIIIHDDFGLVWFGCLIVQGSDGTSADNSENYSSDGESGSEAGSSESKSEAGSTNGMMLLLGALVKAEGTAEAAYESLSEAGIDDELAGRVKAGLDCTFQTAEDLVCMMAKLSRS